MNEVNTVDVILKKHVITYIDLLGTKEKIKNDTDGQVLKILNDLYCQAIKAFTQDIKEHIKMKIFSDNIIIARELPSNEENVPFLINQMIGVAACFQFLLLGGRWPSRGGLTIGDLYMDNTFVWGSGLVRAYELEDKIAIFPRIVIDTSMAEQVKKPSVHAWKMDGGLPIVDVFSLIQNGKNMEGTVLFIREAILDLYKSTNDYTVGKIEWIISRFNEWCVDNKKDVLSIRDKEKLR